MRAVCIGECMMELRSGGGDCFSRGYAGDAYNTAVYLKRSAPEVGVQFLTVTGRDAISLAMREAWKLEGIDEQLAFVRADGAPGLYLIENDATGERRFQYWRKESAARCWFAELAARGKSLLQGADLIYMSGISLAILPAQDRFLALAMLEQLRDQVGLIAFDPNVRPSLWESRASADATLRKALSICHVALPSSEDLRWLFGIDAPDAQLDSLQACHLDEVALTLGARGVLLDVNGTRQLIDGIPGGNVVDTSGAGDSFNGAYLAARLRGVLPSDAARAALEVAGRVVTQAGAVVSAEVSHSAKSP